MNNGVKWQPVEYGWLRLENKELNQEFDAIEVRQSAFESIANNGVLLTISEQWGEQEASVYLPDNIRLCRAVEADGGSPPAGDDVAVTGKGSFVSNSPLTTGEGEPLPCLFCGGTSDIEEYGLGGTWIKCGNRNCPVVVEYTHPVGRSEAVAEWNRRAQPAPPQGAALPAPVNVLEAIAMLALHALHGKFEREDIVPCADLANDWLNSLQPRPGDGSG